MARSENILLSHDREWISPYEAMIVPADFIIEGDPLFTKEDLSGFTTSSPPTRYHDWKIYSDPVFNGDLQNLNCVQFTLQFAHQIVRHRQFSFPEKSNAWLRKFFKYLCSLSSTD
jgi:hypothetical protein